MGIPEVDAREILAAYNGANNQLLEWKKKFELIKNFKLTRAQAEYVIKYKDVVPKVARKYLEISPSFGEKLMEQKLLVKLPTKIWCEKLLCDTDKAYHIWGKVIDTDKLSAMWVPKIAIIQEEKKLNRVIDYTPYNHRLPMEHQKVAVEKLLANNRFILADEMGLGKAILNNTLIYTPYGTKKMGEIVVGDKVIGSDGKSYNVIGVFPQGIKDTYKITFNDGYNIITDDNHLWSVSSSNYGKNTKNNREKKSLVLTTKQMYEGGKIKIKGIGCNKEKEYNIETYYKSPNGNNKWQIPIVSPIQFENKYELPIDPYFLGLMLGDGYFTKYGDCNLLAIKDDYHELYGQYNLTPIKCRENYLSGKVKIKNELKSLDLNGTKSYNKFIPEIYKYSSIENRLSILQGLMDSDGYCMISKKGHYSGTEFSTVSERLCDDVCEIVQTLGGIARKSDRQSFYKKDGKRVDCRISYRVNIKLPSGMNPFRLKRKSIQYNEPQKYPIGRFITNIEKIGHDYCTCISVDSPDNLYVAEHCIVTHNTTSAVIAALESGAKKILIVCPASLKINWKREIENYSDRRTLIVEGGKWGSTFDFYIINYDILKNYHFVEEDMKDRNLIVKEKFDLAIIDEAHFLSNPSAIRTQLLNDILETIPKVWLLTGTPMTSRPINYFNLLKIVDSPLTLNWQRYVKRYCGGYRFKVNNRKIWNTNGATNLDELRESTKSIVLRRLKTEVIDLPEKIITPVYLEMENMMYNTEMEEFIRITNEQKEKESISVTITRLMKIRQLIAIEKIPYTCELIDKFLEQDKKVIVFTNFTMTLDMLHEKYGKNSVVLDGRMNQYKRQESIDRFQNDPKVKVFIGNIIAAGAGITLTAAEGVIMNDLSFVPAHHLQAEDRSHRYGQKNSVLVYYPVFENTIEKIIHNILQKKKNIIDQVMGDGEYSESFTKELIKEIL